VAVDPNPGLRIFADRFSGKPDQTLHEDAGTFTIAPARGGRRMEDNDLATRRC
jgi:hypothetical protein